MSEWQPIETAPQDGIWIILGLKGRSAPGMWQEGYEHGVDYEGRESGWVDIYFNDVDPTCWMPLPEPPK